MKTLLRAFAVIALFAAWGNTASAQCLFTTGFGSATISSTNIVVPIASCASDGEYSTIYGAIQGQTLRFANSGAGFVTIRAGAFNGPVVALGALPLTFVNTFSGTLYAHLGLGSNCQSFGGNNCIGTTTVQNLSAPAPIPNASAPIAICRNATVQLDTYGFARVDAAQIDNGSSASNGTVSMMVSPSIFDCGNIGTNTVIFTVTDNIGNTTTCSAVVTVEDNLIPIVECNIQFINNGPNTSNSSFVNDVTLANDPFQCGAFFEYNIDAVDNCGFPTPTQVAGLPSGSTFPVGTTLNTFVATDASGNTGNCSFNVTVLDVEAPRVICNSSFVSIDPNSGNPIGISDIELPNDPQLCFATYSYTTDANDNCAISTLVQTAGLPSGSTFPIGTTTNSFVATDESGNTASCSFNVTVLDYEAPEALCQDITLSLDLQSQATVKATDIDDGSTDNCGIAAMTVSPSTFGCNNVTHPITELFISEYIEGTGNNKAIEIYNGTGAPVNLAAYSLQMYFNGGTNVGLTIQLTGTVANGDAFVVCHPLANPQFLARADQITSNSGWYNGNDAVVLVKNNATPLDIIGKIGQDPGTGWIIGPLTTVNSTLLRQPFVFHGNTDNLSGFPSLATEWSPLKLNDFGDLGFHSIFGNNIAVLTVTDVNGNTGTCTSNVTILNDPPKVTDGVRCDKGEVKLEGQPGPGGDVNWWYDVPVGGSKIFAGNGYFATFSTSTTLYVSTFNTMTGCESDRVPVTVTIAFPPIVYAGEDATICLGDCAPLNGVASTYAYNFNLDPEGWTAGSLPNTCTGEITTVNSWALQNFGFVGPSMGNVNTGTIGSENSYILSPSLSFGNSVTVDFESFSNNQEGFPCKSDVEFVELSTDDGITWTVMHGFEGDLHKQQISAWRHLSYTMAVTPTSTGRVRFRYDTDQDFSLIKGQPGWYVDNVSIITQSSSNTILWSPAAGLSCTTCSNPIACPDTTTTYTFEVTTSSGCVGSDDVVITVIGAPNDNVCQAISLQPGIAQPFSNVCATTETDEPSAPGGDCNSQANWCDNTIDNTVWFTFQAPASGCVSLLIENQLFSRMENFQMAVWQAPNCSDFGDFQLVAANDDGGPGNAPVITQLNCLVPGTTYFVQVDGFDGFQGSGAITLVECNSVPFSPGYTTLPAAVNNNIDVCLNQPVYFNDSSLGATSWLWEFGDAFVSSAPDATHAYLAPGVYPVQYTVAGTCGNAQVFNTQVTVSPEPGPEILCPSVVCEGDTVTYATPSVCTVYQWSVAGGTIVSAPLNNDSIQVVWGAGTNGGGTVSLALPGCGGLCSAPAFRVVPILPQNSIPDGITLICAGNSSTYSVPCVPGTTYNWTVTSEGYITAGQGTHDITIYWNPTASGTATISLTYENELIGCSGAGTLQVQVLQRFQVSGPTTACEGVTSAPFQAQQLLGNTPVDVDWSVITPANVTLPNLQTNASTFVYDFSAGPGIYYVLATPPSGSYCNDTSIFQVTVTATPPAPAAITGDTLVCPNSTHPYSALLSGNGANLVWSVSGGSPATASGSPIGITWDASGAYTVSVMQLSASNPVCSSPSTTLTVQAYPHLVLPVVSGNDSVCKGAIAQYTFPGPLNPLAIYTWSLNPSNLGTIISANGGNAISVQWTSAGNQDVTAEVVLTVDFCGVQTSSYPVTLFALPQPQIGQPSLLCTGQAAAFTATAGATWAWDFGDGGTAFVQNPSHTYAAPGNYNISLLVTNAAGCQATTQSTVAVAPVPTVPVITGTNAFCGAATSTYSFSAPLSNGTIYTWTVSPAAAGNVVSSTNNSATIHWNAFAGPSNANVVLSISSSCLQTQVTYPVTVNPLPVPVITAPQTICAGVAAAFAAPAGATWAWDFGDGGNATLQNPVHTFATAGSYLVSLAMTNAQGCQASITQTVSVLPVPQQPVLSGQATFCGGATATYSFPQPVTPGVNYQWTISPANAGTIVSSTNSSATIQWNAPSADVAATVTVQVSSACVNTQATFAVTLHALPSANFTSPTVVCSNAPAAFSGPSATTWAWTFGDGGTASVQSPTHTFTTAGTYTTTLLVTDANACTATAATTTVVLPTPQVPVITGPNLFCGANAATYTFSQPLVSGANYLWSIFPTNAGQIVAGNGSNSISVEWANPAASVNAHVLLNVNSSCLQTQQSFAVTVHPAANAAIGLPTPACAGTSLQFSGSAASTYLWNFGDGGNSTQQNPTHTYANSGSYALHYAVSDANGCTAAASSTLTVLPVPQVPVLSGNGVFCGTATATYTFTQPVTLGASYLWSISPNSAGSIVASTSNSVTIKWNAPTADVSAMVLLDVSSPCITAQATFPVTIHPLPLVNFSAPTVLCTGVAANFTGIGGTAWAWNFGDGGTSTAQNPSHTYATQGSYNFTFAVTDANGCSASAFSSVRVFETPVVPVIVGPAYSCGASQATYSFSEPLASGVNYAWAAFPASMGTMTAGTTQSSVSVQWGNPAITTPASIALSVMATCSPIDVHFPVTLYPAATAQIGLPDVACAGQSAQFTGPAGNAWLWDFGDGGSATQQNPLHTYATSGTYNVQLQFTDSNGCSANASHVIVVDPIPTVPVIAGPTINCAGDSSIFNFAQLVSPGASYTWTVFPASAGVPIATGVSNATQVQWGVVMSPTPVTILLRIQSTCMDTTVAFPVILNPKPASSFTFNSPYCTGITVPFAGFGGNAWLWNFGDGGTSTLQNPSHTYTTPGYQNVTLQVSENGCSAISEGYVEILETPVAPVIQGPSVVCVSEETSIYAFSQQAASGTIYHWSVIPATAATIESSNGQSAVTLNWVSAGPATVVLTVTSPCLNTQVTFPVTVNPRPAISIMHASPFCQGALAQFNGPPAATWYWTFGDGDTAIVQNPQHSYQQIGEYPVTLFITDANGCDNSAKTDVLVNPSPKARLFGPCASDCSVLRFCDNVPTSITLGALNGLGYQFSWQPGNFSNGPTATVTGPGTYFVNVTNSYGCSATSGSITLVSDPCLDLNCVTEPHVQDFTFTYDLPSCTQVSFNYDLSANATFSHFEFGDGASTTDLDPSHDYVDPGTYCPTIVATVPDQMNPGAVCTTRVCHTITIPLLADFFTQRSCGANGWQVQLNDLSTYYSNHVIDVWEWYVDGATTPSATGPNPSLAFTPGFHTVALTVTSTATGATCTKSKTFTLPALPVANFSFINPTCANINTAFNNLTTGNIAFGTWDFYNDGLATASIKKPRTYAYPTAGNFQVSLSVTDRNGCTDKLVLPITVNANTGGPITASGPTTFCNGESVVLTAPTSSSYHWSTGATTQNITVTTAGSYNVTLTNANGCQFVTPSVDVVVRPFPVVAITGDHAFCQGGWINLSTVASNLQYIWEYDNLPIDGVWTTEPSTNSLLQIPLPTTSHEGNYRVTVADFQGVCSITTPPFAVTVDAVPSNPTMGISGDTSFCQGGNVTLTAPNGTYYAWSNGATTPSVAAASTGSYAVTVSTVHGCAYGPPPVAVTVFPAPLAAISGRQAYCTGEILNLQTLTGPYAFIWEFDDLPIDGQYIMVPGNAAGISLNLNDTFWTGNFRVTAIDTFSLCSLTTAPYAVVVNQTPAVPTITASGPLTFCQGDSITLTAAGSGTLLWSTGATGTSISVSQTSIYGVRATGAGGCQANSNTVSVEVNPVPSAAISGDSNYCVGELLSLQTAGGPYTFQWSYDALPIDGNYIALLGSSPNLQQSLDSAAFTGNYHVTVTDPTTGCFVVSADYPVEVNAIPATPVITASGPLALCQGNALTLTASGSGNFLWSTGATTPSIAVTQAGNFSVIALGQGGCQATSAAVAVTVLPVPTANITGRSSYCTGEVLALQTNPGPYTFLWERDSLPIDGIYVPVGSNSASLALPLSSTALSGNYRVTATDPTNGCAVTTAPFAVVVNPSPTTPIVTASGSVNLCQGSSVTLTATGTGSFTWSNGATTASIVVSQAGIFSVVATEVGGCQATSAPTAVTVSPVPTASISGQSNYCTGQLLSLQTASGPYTYVWEVDTLPIDGNYVMVGNNSPNLQQALTSTSFSGNYHVKVTDPVSGCFVVAADYAVVVNQTPATPVITASGPTTLCQGNAVTLTASGSGPRLWSNGATTQSIVVSQTGIFTVTAQGLGGCNATSSAVNVTVNPVPIAVITGQNTYCTGAQLNLQTPAGAYNYQWASDEQPIDGQYAVVGNNAANLQLPLTSTGQSGNYHVVVTNPSTGCSTVSADYAILVNPTPATPLISASGPLTFCQGGAVTLVAPLADVYQWSSGATTQNIVVSQSGAFAVTVSTLAGCQATSAPTTVTVNPLPAASIQGNATYCQGDELLLQTISGAYNYQWEYDSLPIDNQYVPVGSNSATLQFVLGTTAFSGNYHVVVTSTATACAFTSPDFAVLVNPVPQSAVIDTSDATTFCMGDDVSLTAPLGVNYAWSTGASTQDITVGYSGSFTVTVTTAEGCPFTAGPVDVVVHPLPTALITGDHVVCSGDMIDLVTAPGNYSYQWQMDALPIDSNYATVGTDAFELSLSATVNLSGDYQVVVTDTLTGCINTSPLFGVLVNPTPQVPIITSTTAGTLCADQTWTLTVSNPEPGVIYTWTTGQVGTSIVALSAGDYAVAAAFANGCAVSSNVITISPSPIIECFPTGCYTHCESLGAFEIAGPSGFALYEWLQEPGQILVGSSQNFTVTQSGSYRLRVTNLAGCSATTDLVSVNFIDCCTTFVATTVSTDLTCFESHDGGVNVNASGGLEPYVYQWNTGDNVGSIQGLAAGIYLVDVYDQNNCVVEIEDTVLQPDLLEIAVVEAPILCAGDSAIVIVSATGGTAPYVGIGAQTLAAGPYQITVTDDHGCTATWDGYLTEPDVLSASASAGAIQCQGDSTVATVTATGGTEPYTGTGSFTVSNGTHVFAVTDANGCTTTTTLIVSPVSTLEATASAGSILCHGGTTTVVIGATGGNPPYAGTGSFVVGAGIHTFLVADANLCTDTVLVNVTEPTALVASATAGTIICHGGTTTVTVTASGGTAPYTGIGTFTAAAGNNAYTVTDANGCTAEVNIMVTQPTLLVANASAGTIACAGGNTTVTVTATGGTTPYTGVGTFTATAGNQSYLVTDAHGCTAIANIVVVTAQDITAPTIACPANITVTTAPGQCSAAVSFVVNATDNCTSPTVVTTPTSGSIFAIGTTTVSAVATDLAGNTATCSFTVTVLANGGGVTWTGVPANVTLSCGAPIPGAPVILPCGSSVGCPPVAICYVGLTHIGDFGGSRYYLSDGAATWTQALNTAQGIGGTLATIDNAAENTYVTNLVGGANNIWIGLNDAGIEGTFGWVSGAASTYRNWQTGQPDNLGNQDYVAWNANTGKWQDLGATALGRFLVEVDCNGGNRIFATNACGPCPTVTMTQATQPGACASSYTLVRTWTATSTTGAVLSTATQTITVTDNIAPVVTCPANITVAPTSGLGTAVVNYTVTATDNCSGASVATVPASGSTFVVGTTAVIATATDACGNSSTCTFNVTVSGANVRVAAPSAGGSEDPQTVQPAQALELIEVYPVPTMTEVKVDFLAPAAGRVRVLVFATDGKLAMDTQRDVLVGRNTVALDVSGLAAGTYYLRIMDGNGALIGKFVKE